VNLVLLAAGIEHEDAGSTGHAESTPPNPPFARGGKWCEEIGPALVCALVGLIVAVEPHLTMLARHGTLLYFGDGDDVLYTTLARAPFRSGWGLGDPFSPAWDQQPTLYSWLQFVPLAKLTALLGIDRLLMPLVWRALGGPMLGLAVYALFRRLLATTRKPVLWALGCSLLSLADAGFVGGQTLYGAVGLVRAIARGDTPMSVPNALGQFRVVSPLLNLPILIGLAAVLIPPVNVQRRAGASLAGAVLLSLCVYLYFYFWTAAVLALVFVILGWIVVGGHASGELQRPGLAALARRERNLAGIVLVGGMILGAPQIVGNARTFSDPGSQRILQRMNRGRALLPEDPARTRYLVNYWVFAKLSLGAAVIVGLRAWRLAPIWAFTLTGYLLANSAVVTGREFENFHWSYVHAPFGEILALASLALILDHLRWDGRWLWAFPAAIVALGMFWRPYEAIHCRESALYNQTLRDLLPMRPALARLGPSDVLVGPWPAGVVVMLGDSGLLYQYDQTLVTSFIPTRSAFERKALSAWLRGLSLDESLEELRFEEEPVDRRRLGRRGLYTGLFSGESGDVLLKRYRPNHLLRPSQDGPPDDARGGPWSLVETRGTWSLWKR
jgi:hypothetical protein